MRLLKFYTVKWRSLERIRSENLAELLREHKDIFDDKFIEQVAKSRESASALAFKLGTFQIPIFALLVFSLIPIQVSVSVLGISPAASRHLREILLVSSSLLGLFTIFLGTYKDSLQEIIRAHTERVSRGDKHVQNALSIAYGLDYFFWPEIPKSQNFGKGVLAFAMLFAAAMIIVLSLVVVGMLTIHVLVLRDIYVDPSFSVRTSIAIIIFVVLCDFISLSIVIFQHGFIRLKDYSNLYAMNKLSERDPAKAGKIYDEIIRGHQKKPLLLRIFSRPKLPPLI